MGTKNIEDWMQTFYRYSIYHVLDLKHKVLGFEKT